MSEKFEKFMISKEKRQEMVAKIRSYFLNERNEEIGDLSASILLDFIVEELAIDFYNQGIQDSYNYINDKIIDVLGLQK